jgi:hypothetical protein
VCKNKVECKECAMGKYVAKPKCNHRYMYLCEEHKDNECPSCNEYRTSKEKQDKGRLTD